MRKQLGFLLLIFFISSLFCAHALFAADVWATVTPDGLSNVFSVASDATGNNLITADSNGGYIYISHDRGATWSPATSAGTGYWQYVASSSDGVHLVALASDVFTSDDSGLDWVDQTSTSDDNFQSIASSSDGSHLAVYDYITDDLYTSTDYGGTWNIQPAAGENNWTGIASSDNGERLVAITSNNGIFTSSDAGATWSLQSGTSDNNWVTVASSGTGQYLIAATYSGGGGNIYTSSDYGASWQIKNSGVTGTWQSAAISDDGTHLAAGISNGDLYTSSDSGATWTDETAAGSLYWRSLSFSLDGTKLAAAAYDGNASIANVYVSSPVFAPTVTSSDATSITTAAATLNGTIADTGGQDATARGFHYGLTSGYGTDAGESGSFASGAFTESLSGLVCGTMYYFQAYATNGVGTSTSSPGGSFTTSACPAPVAAPAPIVQAGHPAPIIPASNMNSISLPSAQGLDFAIDNGASVTHSKNVVLSLNANPATVSGYAVSLSSDFSQTGIMPFSSSVSFALPNNPGLYTIYLEYFSPSGIRSSVVSHSITYTTSLAAISLSAPFSRNLTIGSVGSDVLSLQKFLNAQGFTVALSGVGSKGEEGTLFGQKTASALMLYQKAHGIKPATGYFGSLTRINVNDLLKLQNV